MSERTVVIGGGAIGLMTAYHLAREGVQVAVIDARQTGRGAAEVNAGWVCPGECAPVPGPGMVTKSLKWMLHSDSPLYIRPSLDPSFARFMFGLWRSCTAAQQRAGYLAGPQLAHASTVGYDEYRQDGLDFELRSAGLLLAYATSDGLHAHTQDLDVARQFDLDPEVLVADAVREREPMLADTVYGGLWFPHEHHLDPNALMRALHRRLVELGVTIIEDAPLRAVNQAGTRVASVFAGGQQVAGDRFILATGAWTGQTARLFGVHLPVRPGKGYSIDTPPLNLRTCTNLADAKVAVTPLADRLRLAGTMEFGGRDEARNQLRVNAILAAPGRYFRGWRSPDPATLNPRAGLRPMTPDGLPIIGQLGDFDNAYVSTGHGMMGITFGPGSAALLTDLVLHGRHDQRLEPFSPARFSRNPISLARVTRRTRT